MSDNYIDQFYDNVMKRLPDSELDRLTGGGAIDAIPDMNDAAYKQSIKNIQSAGSGTFKAAPVVSDDRFINSAKTGLSKDAKDAVTEIQIERALTPQKRMPDSTDSGSIEVPEFLKQFPDVTDKTAPPESLMTNEQYEATRPSIKGLTKFNPVEIEGSASMYHVDAPGYPENKFPYRPAESYKENINTILPVLESNVADRKSAVDALREMIRSKETLSQGALDDLKNSLPPYQPAMDYRGEMAKLRDQNDAIQDPETSGWTQAILSLGPAFLGALTGESGALAAPKAQTQAQQLVDSKRKELISRNILMRKNISDRIQALAKAEANDIQRYTDTQKLALDKAKAVVNAADSQARYGKEDLAQQNEQLKAAQKQLDDAFLQGSKGASDLQQKNDTSLNSLKGQQARADSYLRNVDEREMNRIQDQIPKDPVVQGVRKARTNLAQAMSMLDDPNVPKTPQVLADVVQGVIAAVNTQRQSIGAERHDKMITPGLMGKLQDWKNYLSSAQGPVPEHAVREIAGLLHSMHDSEERVYKATIDQTVDALAATENRPLFQRHPEYKQMMKNYGEDIKGVMSNPVPIDNSSQIKVIGGVKYKKVPGGWQKVQ